MPDSNLPFLLLTPDDLIEVKQRMPDTPREIIQRLTKSGLSDLQIQILLNVHLSETAKSTHQDYIGPLQFFEEVSTGRAARVVANWMINELLGQLSFRSLSFAHNPISPEQMGELIDMTEDGRVKRTAAKAILRRLMDEPHGASVLKLAEEVGFLSSQVPLKKLCAEAITALPSEAAAVRDGNLGPLNRLVGQVMRLSKGSADAVVTRNILISQLKGATA